MPSCNMMRLGSVVSTIKCHSVAARCHMEKAVTYDQNPVHVLMRSNSLMLMRLAMLGSPRRHDGLHGRDGCNHTPRRRGESQGSRCQGAESRSLGFRAFVKTRWEISWAPFLAPQPGDVRRLRQRAVLGGGILKTDLPRCLSHSMIYRYVYIYIYMYIDVYVYTDISMDNLLVL